MLCYSSVVYRLTYLDLKSEFFFNFWFSLCETIALRLILDERYVRTPIELGSVRTEWLTVVSSKADGLCIDSVQDRVPVRFGVNVRSGCFIRYVLFNGLCGSGSAYASGIWNKLYVVLRYVSWAPLLHCFNIEVF